MPSASPSTTISIELLAEPFSGSESFCRFCSGGEFSSPPKFSFVLLELDSEISNPSYEDSESSGGGHVERKTPFDTSKVCMLGPEAAIKILETVFVDREQYRTHWNGCGIVIQEILSVIVDVIVNYQYQMRQLTAKRARRKRDPLHNSSTHPQQAASSN